MGLYEHIILESLEMGERDLGRELLRTTEPMIMLKADQPERYLKLEHLCQRPFFNASDAYEMGSSKEKRYRTFKPYYFCFALLASITLVGIFHVKRCLFCYHMYDITWCSIC